MSAENKSLKVVQSKDEGRELMYLYVEDNKNGEYLDVELHNRKETQLVIKKDNNPIFINGVKDIVPTHTRTYKRKPLVANLRSETQELGTLELKGKTISIKTYDDCIDVRKIPTRKVKERGLNQKEIITDEHFVQMFRSWIIKEFW